MNNDKIAQDLSSLCSIIKEQNIPCKFSITTRIRVLIQTLVTVISCNYIVSDKIGNIMLYILPLILIMVSLTHTEYTRLSSCMQEILCNSYCRDVRTLTIEEIRYIINTSIAFSMYKSINVIINILTISIPLLIYLYYATI